MKSPAHHPTANQEASEKSPEEVSGQAIDSLPFIVTLTALTALSATTVDICIPAQPTIASSFGAQPEAGGIIVSAYLLGYGPGQLFWGPLADRYGRMRPLMVGLLGFILVSIGCVFATSLDSLALLRIAQGLFGGSGPVIARAIARDQGGGQRTARLLATIAMIFGAAPMLAPVLGSGLLLVTDWTGQFWFLAGLGVALVFAAQRFVGPGARGPRPRDAVKSSYLGTVAKLLRERDFVVGCGALMSVFFGYATLISIGSAMTETRYGISPAGFGPLFALAASAVIFGPWLGRRILRTRSTVFALRVGAGICALASLALLIMAGLNASLPVLWSAVFGYVLGFGMLIPLANAIALEPAGEAAGLASSLLGAAPTLAGAAGAGLAAGAGFASPYQAICTIMGGSGLLCLAVVVLGTMRRSTNAPVDGRER